MNLGIDELRGKLLAAFIGIGVPVAQAHVAADVCLQAELLGRVTHGVRLAGNVSREYHQGASRRRPVEVLRDSPATALLDGGFQCSLWVHRQAAELAADKASASGVSVVAVRNAGVSGALGLHTEAMARRGVNAVALNAAPAVVVPPDGRTALLGTNPMSIAVPSSTGEPLVLDMATSAVSFNEVLVARAAGRELPFGVAVDSAGRPTRDPAQAVDSTGRGRLLPFGGHRGFGLALMVELLAGAGVGHLAGSAKHGPTLADPSYFPGLYLAWRPDVVGDPASADDAGEQLLRDLVGEGVRLPGATSRRRRAAALERGALDVAAESVSLLDRLAAGEVL